MISRGENLRAKTLDGFTKLIGLSRTFEFQEDTIWGESNEWKSCQVKIPIGDLERIAVILIMRLFLATQGEVQLANENSEKRVSPASLVKECLLF